MSELESAIREARLWNGRSQHETEQLHAQVRDAIRAELDRALETGTVDYSIVRAMFAEVDQLTRSDDLVTSTVGTLAGILLNDLCDQWMLEKIPE